MDAGDASRRLGELVALAAGDLAPLHEAIGELDRREAGELLLAAVLRVASLEAAAGLPAAGAGGVCRLRAMRARGVRPRATA